MGACADREVYFEKESVKELRARMVVEYLKSNESDVKNTRSTSVGPRRSTKVPRRTHQLDFDKDSESSRSSKAAKSRLTSNKNYELTLEAIEAPPKSLFPATKARISLPIPKEPDKGPSDFKAPLPTVFEEVHPIKSPLEIEAEEIKTIEGPMQKINTDRTSYDFSDISSGSPGKFFFDSKFCKFPEVKEPEILATNNKEFLGEEEKTIQSGLENNKVESSQNEDKVRESIVSFDFEYQAIGVNLPPARPSELSITPGFSQLIAPLHSKCLQEGLPHSFADSPHKDFLSQIPKNSFLFQYDSEPTPAIIIHRDYSNNRPASPRVNSYKIKYKSIKTSQILHQSDKIIPEIPNSIHSFLVNNPFNIADSLISQGPEKIQVFAENPEEEIGNFREEIMIESFQAENCGELFTSPENLMRTPELENLEGRFSEINMDIDNYRRNCVYTPDIDENFNRKSSPDVQRRNRSVSPEFSCKFYNALNESKDSSSFLPKIHVFGADNSFEKNEELRISDIRKSLNGSVISRVHVLRSPLKILPPELSKKNLQGKLTAEEELMFTSKG